MKEIACWNADEKGEKEKSMMQEEGRRIARQQP